MHAQLIKIDSPLFDHAVLILGDFTPQKFRDAVKSEAERLKGTYYYRWYYLDEISKSYPEGFISEGRFHYHLIQFTKHEVPIYGCPDCNSHCRTEEPSACLVGAIQQRELPTRA